MSDKKLIESSYLARFILLNKVDITDYEIFPWREIRNAPPVFNFSSPVDQTVSPSILEQSIPSDIAGAPGLNLDQFLERNETVAFLVIRNDRIICERYYHGYQHDSICTSFSTVKSFVSAMIGIALSEKLIADLDDPITKYISDLKGAYWSEISIRSLVSMSSGLRYNQNGFLPWNDEPRVYYSLDLRKLARTARFGEAPGIHFHYNNYNLLLLGMILEQVTGVSVCSYLQEKIWKPLGMEYPATWSLDSKTSGMEKMESGLNARAIDFARFGRLYLRRGDWNGRRIVPEDWVIKSTSIEPDAKWTNYKYLWWLPRSGTGRFMAVGNLGQFIYVAPDKDCIILRFGRGRPRNWQSAYPRLFAMLMEEI